MNAPLIQSTFSTADDILLGLRQNKYNRLQVFCNMIGKHATRKCGCKKRGKMCDYSSNYVLSTARQLFLKSILDGENYVKDNINFFETMYNTSQSITQSLRCRSGKEFEDSFEDVLKSKKIDYSNQVGISSDGIIGNKGHRVDFMIPPPVVGSNIKDYTGDIISLKTTLRERFLQDKYLGNIVVITLDDSKKIQDDSIIVIVVKKNDTQLEKYLKLKIKR